MPINKTIDSTYPEPKTNRGFISGLFRGVTENKEFRSVHKASIRKPSLKKESCITPSDKRAYQTRRNIDKPEFSQKVKSISGDWRLSLPEKALRENAFDSNDPEDNILKLMVWQKYWEDYWYKPLEKGALGPSPKAELIKNRPLRFQGKSRMDAYNPMYYTYNFGSDHGIPRSKTVSRLLDVVHSLSDMDFGVEPVSVKPVSTEPVKGINTSIKGFTGKKKIDEDTPKQDTKERRFKRFRNAIHQIKSRCKSSGSRNRIETNKAKDNSLKNNRQTQLQPERIEQKENHKSSTNKASNTVIPRKNFIILGELTVNDKSRVPLGYSRLWKETEKMGKRSVKIQHRQCCGTN